MTKNRFYFKLLPVISISLTCQRLWLHKKKKKGSFVSKEKIKQLKWEIFKGMSPCHILAHACASIKHKLLFNLRSSNMLAQGIFFFPNCYFSSAYRWRVNFSSVFSSLSQKERQRSASEIQQGLGRAKWNQSPLPGCSQSPSPTRQWQEMLRNSWCREHNFPLQLQPYWCAFLCTLWSSMPSPGISPLKHSLIGNVHKLWSLWLLFLIARSICWLVCCIF